MPSRVDDPAITNDDILWRRVIPDWIEREGGALRVTSMAFKDRRTDEVSVHIARLTTLETIVNAYPDQGIVAVTAGVVRSAGEYVIERVPEDDDPSHAVIYPSPSKSAARTIARSAEWVRKPPLRQ